MRHVLRLLIVPAIAAMALTACGDSAPEEAPELPPFPTQLVPSSRAVLDSSGAIPTAMPDAPSWTFPAAFAPSQYPADTSADQTFTEPEESRQLRENLLKAIDELDARIAADPEDAFAYYGRANVHYRLGQPLKAVDDYTAAVRLDLVFNSLFIRRARAYLAAGMLVEAQHDLSEAVRRGYPPRSAWRELTSAPRPEPASSSLATEDGDPEQQAATDPAPALAPEKRAELEASLAALGAMIEANPGDGLAHYDRGNTYFELGQLQLAIEDYTTTVFYRAGFADVYISRARAYMLLGNEDGAYNDLIRAVAYGYPPDAAIRELRTMSRPDSSSTPEVDLSTDQSTPGIVSGATVLTAERRAELEAEIMALGALIDAAPGTAVNYLDRGRKRMALAEFEGAVEDFTRALAIRPDDGEALAARAFAYALLGHNIAAQADTAAAASLGLPAQMLMPAYNALGSD